MSRIENYRWPQLFMATTLLWINIGPMTPGVIALTITNGSDLGMKPIFYEFSLAMVVAGIVSYILFIVQLFVLPNYTCTTSCSCNEVSPETSDQQEEAGPSGPVQQGGSGGCQADADEASR